MRKYNIEPKRIRFIHPKDNKAANIVLIEGRKNSRPGLKIQPPIISHQENGDYTHNKGYTPETSLREIVIGINEEELVQFDMELRAEIEFKNAPLIGGAL